MTEEHRVHLSRSAPEAHRASDSFSADSLIPGSVNFRDIGGLSAGATRTRAGTLYRSGNLSKLDSSGVAALQRLGLKRIVDLRGDDEVDRAPNVTGDIPLDTSRVPLFLGSVASFYERDVTLIDLYRTMVDESADRVVEVVRTVIVDQPVLVHCTVGKDRTGVAVALALAAAGVDEDAIVADYARSEGLIPESRNREIVAWLQSLHPTALHIEELATRSPAEAMHGLLLDLRTRFGSPTDYLRAHGLADDEVTALRRVLVTEPSIVL